MDDVKSNGVEDGELKLREARLEFRGSKKEDSEVGVKVEMVMFLGGSRVSAASGPGERKAKRQPLFDDCLVVYSLCLLWRWGWKRKKIRQRGNGGGFKMLGHLVLKRARQHEGPTVCDSPALGQPSGPSMQASQPIAAATGPLSRQR